MRLKILNLTLGALLLCLFLAPADAAASSSNKSERLPAPTGKTSHSVKGWILLSKDLPDDISFVVSEQDPETGNVKLESISATARPFYQTQIATALLQHSLRNFEVPANPLIGLPKDEVVYILGFKSNLKILTNEAELVTAQSMITEPRSETTETVVTSESTTSVPGYDVHFNTNTNGVTRGTIEPAPPAGIVVGPKGGRVYHRGDTVVLGKPGGPEVIPNSGSTTTTETKTQITKNFLDYFNVEWEYRFSDDRLISIKQGPKTFIRSVQQ